MKKEIILNCMPPFTVNSPSPALSISVIRYTFCFLLFSFSAFLLLCFSAIAQNPNCYRITFSDKNNSPYSVNRPEEFLSQRAIEKRVRFNIPVIEQDLPVNPQYIEAILNLSSEQSQIISKSKWDNSVVIFYPETENCHSIIAEMINNLSFVVDTLPVAYYEISKKNKTPIYEKLPSNMVSSSSTCDYDYGNSVDNINLHNGELLHKAGFCGEGMLICVFDGGWKGFDTISYFKPLYEKGQIWGTRDLVTKVNNVYTRTDHGTYCTSQLASTIEGKMVGAAPKANYFFIRSEDPWTEQLIEEDFWAFAAELADSIGTDVVSSSVGYTTFDYDWQNLYTSADNNGTASIASRAATTLTEKGVIVVNAAGNQGLFPWRYLVRPADAFNILAVGAVTKNGLSATFSSYGPSSDGRVKPDVAALGEKLWSVTGKGKIVNTGGATSGATPIIAGLSACLWQALPQYSSLEIKQLIRKYGDMANNPDDRTGYGIPNFYQCYIDHYTEIQENKIPEVSVYPNPTTGDLRIMNYDLRIEHIEIYDVFGRKVFSNHLITSSFNYIINISYLPKGIYIIRIQTEKGMLNKKIIKI